MKGIILAGGAGTRMHPMTLSVSKQLLHVYDKPAIYYPVSTLIDSGVTDILIITQPENVELFSRLFGEGEDLGISVSYAPQSQPNGIAEALLIARDVGFWLNGPATLILGDNIFDDEGLGQRIEEAGRKARDGMSTVFLTQVSDPSQYGVAVFDGDKNLIDIIEKPDNPPSPYAVTGLYVYPETAYKAAKKLVLSARGELEITDVNRMYLQKKRLRHEMLKANGAWLDMGTASSLLQAANYVQMIQDRQGRQLGSPEISAFRRGLVSQSALSELSHSYRSNYGYWLWRAANRD